MKQIEAHVIRKTPELRSTMKLSAVEIRGLVENTVVEVGEAAKRDDRSTREVAAIKPAAFEVERSDEVTERLPKAPEPESGVHDAFDVGDVEVAHAAAPLPFKRWLGVGMWLLVVGAAIAVSVA